MMISPSTCSSRAASTSDSGFSIVDDALGFVDTLNGRGYPNLRATATVLAGDGHSNCIGNAVSKGLRALL
ncbi:MAG: hypothetical protein R2710_30120 [Acidimicrobiales bacterium]